MADTGEPDGTEPLTDEQMRDLVPVAHPQTAAEAAFIVSILEENEIPAVSHGQDTPMLGIIGSAQVCVPRALALDAKSVLDTARANANSNRLIEAFDVENIEASIAETDNDPILAEMFQLLDSSLEERKSLLAPHLIRWASEGVTELQTAKYLAAAGIPREEAADLVCKILEQHFEELENSRANRRTAGYLFLSGAGLLMLATVIFFPRFLTINAWVAIGMMTAGLLFISNANRPVPKLAMKVSSNGNNPTSW
jgi:hypothetical protein